ncbi:MAG TPA: adenylate/guanylate cyclase domain-containing protein [Longimicrobiaceae bacterium]|jgi:class 3 adenylate cyclase
MGTSKLGVDLRRLPVFADCDATLLSEIEPLLATKLWRDGDPLFHEGEEPKELFVILKGQVTISFGGTLIVPRGANELIGEQAFIEQTVRGATVRAQGLVEALVIPRPVVERLLREPAFAHNLLRQLSKKLNQATGDRAFRYRVEHLLFGEFRSHVSPEVLQELISSREDYGAPRIIDAVILFADIRGFTAQSEQLEPEEIATQLTAFLDHAVETVHEYGGLVDKFIGDAMMAVWGGFRATGEDLAEQAFNCAMRLVESAPHFQFGDGPIELGIGLNGGEVFMGIIGGKDKRQFTVLGAPVNLASRYQRLSAELGAPVVLGPDFCERLNEDFRSTLLEHPRRQIKGAGEQILYTWAPAGSGTATTTTGVHES